MTELRSATTVLAAKYINTILFLILSDKMHQNGMQVAKTQLFLSKNNLLF